MKSTKQFVLVLLLITLYSCQKDSKSQESNEKGMKETYQEKEDPDCIAPSDWFTHIDGVRKTPAPKEGPDSPFADNATVTNCDFHKWSWQKFLWLTNETHKRPFFLDRLIHVSADGEPVKDDDGIVLTAIAQASSSKDILKTNPAFSATDTATDTVYYSIHLDSLFYKTMVKYGPIAKEDPSKVEKEVFPVGALELKISWINAETLADTTSYFITDGNINGTKRRVALLGMHVVGVVENHPEFVWATFEHEGLAPKYDWSKATPTSDAPVTSTENHLFFNKDSTATVKNITSQNGIYTDIFAVYQYGIPVEKVAVVGTDSIVQAYMNTSQDGEQTFNNNNAINTSVKSQLKDVWKNYFYNGSIWIDTEGYEGTAAQAAVLDSLSYHLSNSKEGDLTRGSVSAYNITMESYVQVGFTPTSIHGQTVGNLVNCFSCHNAAGNNNNLSPLYLSHVFNGYVKNLQGLSKKEIKQQHVDEIREHFTLRKNKE